MELCGHSLNPVKGVVSCKVGTSVHHRALPLIPKMTFASAHSYLNWGSIENLAWRLIMIIRQIYVKQLTEYHVTTTTKNTKNILVDKHWGAISLLSVGCFSSVQSLSHVQHLETHGLQHTRLPCPWPTPRVCSDSCPLMPSNHLILCHSLLLPPSIFPNTRVFSNVSSSHQVAKVLEFQLQHQSF